MFPVSLAARHSHSLANKLEGENCLKISGKDFPPWLLFFLFLNAVVTSCDCCSYSNHLGTMRQQARNNKPALRGRQSMRMGRAGVPDDIIDSRHLIQHHLLQFQKINVIVC